MADGCVTAVYNIGRRYICRLRNSRHRMKISRNRIVRIVLLFVIFCIVHRVFVIISDINSTVEIPYRPFVKPTLKEDRCFRRKRSLPVCPAPLIESDKSVPVSFELKSYDDLVNMHGKNVSNGGHYSPLMCEPNQRVAIVIPFRDREKHLRILLNNLHPFLKKQNIDYTIIVVEQLPGSKLNRGMLKNIGFVEGLKVCNFDCFFFHDVDMIPNDYGNVYQCGPQPRHHARNLVRWNNKEPYPGNFGGVVSMKTDQFIKVNGYPSSYFEWGVEDDELGERVKFHKMNISSYPFEITSYKEPEHSKGSAYLSRLLYFMKWRQRLGYDGINSLYYTVKRIEYEPLYTHLYVDIDMSKVEEAYQGHIYVGGGFDIKIPSFLTY